MIRAFMLGMAFISLPAVASSQTANPFSAETAPAPPPVVIPTQAPQQVITRPLPPLSFFAVIGNVALLSDGNRVLRVPDGHRVTIDSVTYRAAVRGDVLTLNQNGRPAFYATVGYGVALNQNSEAGQ